MVIHAQYSDIAKEQMHIIDRRQEKDRMGDGRVIWDMMKCEIGLKPKERSQEVLGLKDLNIKLGQAWHFCKS